MKSNLKIMAGVAVALVGLTVGVQATTIGLQYSTDGSTWTSANITSIGNTTGGGGFTYNGWTITSLGGTLTGSTTDPILDLGTLDLSGSGSLYVELSATGFGPTVGGVTGHLGGNLGNGNTVDWSGYASSANTLYSTSSSLFSLLGLTAANVSSGANASGAINFTAYSLTEEFIIHAGSSSQSDSLDGKITVPDGGLTVGLLGMALGACSLFARKLKKA